MKLLYTILISALFLNCSKKETDNNTTLAALALLNSSSVSTSAADNTTNLSTPVGKASAVSSSISSISSSTASASNASSFTQNSLQSEELMAINNVLRFGKDSAISKASVKSLMMKKIEATNKEKSRENLRLTAWSTATTDADGYSVYTYSGTVKGYNFTTTTTDMKAATTTPTVTCNVTMYNYYEIFGLTKPSNIQGSATFSNGELKTKNASNSSTGTYNNSSINKGTIVFTDYGTIYGDIYKGMALYKKYNGTNLAKNECATIQAYYSDYLASYLTAKISGNLTFNSSSSFQYAYSGTTATYTGTYESTSSSTGLSITMNGQSASNVVISNLVYKGVSDYTLDSSTGKYAGKYTITITGTIDGSAINETIVITF